MLVVCKGHAWSSAQETIAKHAQQIGSTWAAVDRPQRLRRHGRVGFAPALIEVCAKPRWQDSSSRAFASCFSFVSLRLARHMKVIGANILPQTHSEKERLRPVGIHTHAVSLKRVRMESEEFKRSFGNVHANA